MLKREQDGLDFCLVSYDSIKRYHNDFRWVEWYNRELYENMNSNLRDKIVDNQMRLLEQVSQKNEEYGQILDISEQQMIEAKKTVDFNDTRSIDTASKLSYLYKSELESANRFNKEFNESYLSTMQLVENNASKQSPLVEIVKLSKQYQEQEEEQEIVQTETEEAKE